MILVFSTREPIHAPLQEAHAPIEEVRKDQDDLLKLIGQSQRPQIRSFLTSFSKRLDRQIERQEVIFGLPGLIPLALHPQTLAPPDVPIL